MRKYEGLLSEEDEKYLSMSFDVIYGNWKRECEHCQIVADAS